MAAPYFSARNTFEINTSDQNAVEINCHRVLLFNGISSSTHRYTFQSQSYIQVANRIEMKNRRQIMVRDIIPRY